MTAPRVTQGACAIAGVGSALYFAARTTGAGWLLVILCALAGVLLVGAVWPRIGLHRVRVSAHGPRDAMVGESIPITLRVSRAGLGVRILPVVPPGDVTGAVGDLDTVVDVIADRRGVLGAIEIELSSAAPFGLVWWRRRRSVALERAVEVAPRVGSSDLDLPATGAPGDTETTGAGRSGDQVRGVRDYAPGDPLRLVHWPATARRGAVVVKEFEQPEQPRLELLVDLRGPTTAAEQAAERAMGLVCDALARGTTVILGTAESSGPRRAPVTSRLDAGRRLARATAGALPAPEAGAQVCVISGQGQR